MGALTAGAERAIRRAENLDRTQLVECSLDAGRSLALDRARELVTQYLGQRPHNHFGRAPIAARRDWQDPDVPAGPAETEKAIALVPDDVVQFITASGTPDECRAKVRESVGSGATCPILHPLGDDVGDMIDAFEDGKF